VQGGADPEEIQTLLERVIALADSSGDGCTSSGPMSPREIFSVLGERAMSAMSCVGVGSKERRQVAGQVVLTPPVRVAAAVVVAAGLVGGRASADNVDDDDLVKPKRLTVGVADDLLGQLGPDGKTLYFVSNRNTTNQIFAQNMADGHAEPLFDDGADVTWPRVSPDGRFSFTSRFARAPRGSSASAICRREMGAGASMIRPPRCRPSGSIRIGSCSSAAVDRGGPATPGGHDRVEPFRRGRSSIGT
jgi:hypothetical protein